MNRDHDATQGAPIEVIIICDGDRLARSKAAREAAANLNVFQVEFDAYIWSGELNNSHCPICKQDLNGHNINRHTAARSLRLDSGGRAWCNECTEKFDSIDWDEVRNS